MPEYEIIVIAARIPMTTITTKRSTRVKPALVLNLFFFCFSKPEIGGLSRERERERERVIVTLLHVFNIA